MLKKSTIEELHKMLQVFKESLNFLHEKCEGILKNEMIKKYVAAEDIKNQKKLIDNIQYLYHLINSINAALREGNAEKLRANLIDYLTALENIFSASEKIHLAHEVPYQKGAASIKGRYLETHRVLINICIRANELIQRDRHIKDEMGNASKLAEDITKINKELGALLGIKTVFAKNEKVVKFERITPTNRSNHAEITMKTITRKPY